MSYFTYDNDEFLAVYTDGSCLRNGYAGAQAGIGVFFGKNHPLNVSEPAYGPATNNNAEIEAATRALEICKDHGQYKVRVYLDSQFTINCMTIWLDGWKNNGWTLTNGGPVKNRDALMRLDHVKTDMDVYFEFVPRASCYENKQADRLARQGAAM